LPLTAANPRGISPVAEPASRQASANRRGIVAMLCAMSCFTCSDALLKTMTAQLTAGQIMTIRGVFATAIMIGLIVARGEIRQIAHVGTTRVLLRAVLEAVIAFLFIVSLTHLPLANLTAILQATPLMMTLIAVGLGLEAVGWRRWSAIAVGFVGVLLIVKPSAAGFNTYAIISLGTAALVAVRDIVTRGIGGHISTTVVTLSTTATVTLLGLGLSVAEEWRPITWSEVGLLGIAAVFVCLGNMAVVRAFRIGEMSVVSPFRYAIILTSLVAGFIVFGEWPDAVATCGIVLIVLSGVYTVHREQIRARAAARTGE
jgi:drug/metabolite transporter (DMT)-like permease